HHRQRHKGRPARGPPAGAGRHRGPHRRAAGAAGRTPGERVRLHGPGAHPGSRRRVGQCRPADRPARPGITHDLLRSGGPTMSAVATVLHMEFRLVVLPAYLGDAALTLFILIPLYPMILGISDLVPAVFIALSEANV